MTIRAFAGDVLNMRYDVLSRRRIFFLIAFALLVAGPRCFAAAGADDPEVDCPAAFRPYSSGTPLLDLLLNPQAKAVVERDLPGFLSKLPPMLTKANPPTLADILTIRIMSSEFSAIPEEALSKLDKDLALVPVTREAAIARCARYDHTPPVLPEHLDHPAMLVFSKSNGFRDDPSVNAANAALKAMAGTRALESFLLRERSGFQRTRFEALRRSRLEQRQWRCTNNRTTESFQGLHRERRRVRRGSWLRGRFLLRLELVPGCSHWCAVQVASDVAAVPGREAEDRRQQEPNRARSAARMDDDRRVVLVQNESTAARCRYSGHARREHL